MTLPKIVFQVSPTSPTAKTTSSLVMEFFRAPPQTALFPVTSAAFVTAALQQSSPSNLPIIPSPTDIITTATSTSPVPVTTSSSPPCLPMFLNFPSTSTTTSILMDTVLAAQKLNQQQQAAAAVAAAATAAATPNPFNFLVVKQENPLPVIANPASSPPHVIKL
ncbi:hypothetical protein B9Z55_013420 [Caenorhabditis nigoni]|uniref:Uncharacterized protein n=1 Tax=Caenorhabditis nigoni TaxID=1611254 RepID=A0A2G5U1M5_9PELO|nr:hypothetical protein B9Z55_013420 [Caenorhabditis nigoni]